MYSLLNKTAEQIARGMALLGGAVLLILVIITCISIFGRALIPLDIGLGPIQGIYDYTEIGMATAVFAFLPWCQFNRGHAVVDLFKASYSDHINGFLDVIFDIAMLIAAFLIAHRLYLGMLDKQRYNETTLIAQVPVWLGYAASLVGAVAFVYVAAFCVIRSIRILAGMNSESSPNV